MPTGCPPILFDLASGKRAYSRYRGLPAGPAPTLLRQSMGFEHPKTQSSYAVGALSYAASRRPSTTVNSMTNTQCLHALSSTSYFATVKSYLVSTPVERVASLD